MILIFEDWCKSTFIKYGNKQKKIRKKYIFCRLLKVTDEKEQEYCLRSWDGTKLSET